MQPVKWGILSTANIGTQIVIPAMMQSPSCDVRAIASRDLSRAQQEADRLGIRKAYGTYEELFNDPDIEAIYNPLPNHMHASLSIQAAEAGKHVLCEKPLALSVNEIQDMIQARDRTGCLITEAFMVRHHPQWQRAREIIRSGELGELRIIQSTFGFHNDDPHDIRNRPETGGGALYDIGVYPITATRYFFGREPDRVLGVTHKDPTFKTDILTNGILDYGSATSSFSVSTQMVDYQRLHLLGTKGRIEIKIPYNAPLDAETTLYLDDGTKLADASAKSETFAPCNQYQLQAENFNRYIREGKKPEFPLEDSLAQMRIIEALLRSSETERWAKL